MTRRGLERTATERIGPVGGSDATPACAAQAERLTRRAARYTGGPERACRQVWSCLATTAAAVANYTAPLSIRIGAIYSAIIWAGVMSF